MADEFEKTFRRSMTRPSPSTVTDELAEGLAKQAIDRSLARLKQLHDYAGRPTWDAVLAEEIRTALASGHTALLRENAGLKHDLERQMTIANIECNEAEELREALTDIRNRILCPVGPSPTLDELEAIASAALSRPA